MMTARKKAMTEIEALVEAFTRFDGAAAAKIDWERLFPDWDSPVRRRYVHNTRSAAAGVLCPEGRPGCYQELRENSETGEWRAVCGRDSEECARRTLTRQQFVKWALDVRTLCQDITDSLKTGAIPHECAPGVWDCGQIRVETKQAGILFVIGGAGLSERLACARGIYDGAGVVIPSIKNAHKGALDICESAGSVVLGLAEHCRVEQGRIMVKSLEGCAKVLAGVHGTGMTFRALVDKSRTHMTVSRQPIEESSVAEGRTDKRKTQVRVIREKEAIAIDTKTYTFSGKKRWLHINSLLEADGEYVKTVKNFKSLFAKNSEAKAFFERAIEAENRGRNGTGRYRLKI